MLNFLANLRRKAPEITETQRERFERLIVELNESIDLLADKPKITIEPLSGHIDLERPEQFPDEALALPAPTPEPEVDTPSEDATKSEDEAPKPESEKTESAAA